MITQILFVDAEKPPEYLPRFFGHAQGVQVIVISQEVDTSRTKALAESNGALFLAAGQPHIGDICVWDVLASLRQIWGWIEGEYVTFAHPEFLWLPGVIEETKKWLALHGTRVALGNLRRIMSERRDNYRGNLHDTHEALGILDCGGDIHAVPTKPWAYWRDEPANGNPGWVEDVFFARKDFFDVIRFPHHGGSQPFQDVYDLMGVVSDVLKRYQLPVDVIRMPRGVGEMWHLYHDRPRSWVCPEVKAWFQSRNGQYADSPLRRDDIWERLLNNPDYTVMTDVRRGPGGTCSQYQAAFSRWLHFGGKDEVKAYFGNGQQNR